MDLPKTTHESASGDNTEAIITISCEEDESVYLTHLSTEFSGNATDIPIRIEDGNTTIWQRTIADKYGDDWDFSIPLKGTEGQDIVITLDPSGSGGTMGTVYASYFKGE